MKPLQTTLGIPDTLRPLDYGELRGSVWFGGFGFLLLLLGLFHNAVFFRATLLCWMALPVVGILRQLGAKPKVTRRPASVAVWIYTILVVGVGTGFYVWARHLGLAWPVIIGALFIIEGLAGATASLTEWWRLSLFGHAMGLMLCGFGIPFVDKDRAGVLVGAAVLFGSLLSAAILHWQIQQHKAQASCAPETTPPAP